MNRKTFPQGMLPASADLTGFEDGIERTFKHLVNDRLGSGIITGLTVGESAPASLSVVVAAGTAYSQDAPNGDLGTRISVAAPTPVDCSVDENGVSTGVAVNMERYISVVARFSRIPANVRQDINMPQAEYMDQFEGAVLKVKAGAAAATGAAVKPAIASSEQLLCDLKITYLKTTIVTADIDASRRATGLTMPELLTMINAAAGDYFTAPFTGYGTTGPVGGSPGSNTWITTGITQQFTSKMTGVYYAEFSADVYDGYNTTLAVLAKIGPGSATLADGAAIPTQGGTLLRTITALSNNNGATRTMSCVVFLIAGQTYTFTVYGSSPTSGTHEVRISGGQVTNELGGWKIWRIA